MPSPTYTYEYAIQRFLDGDTCDVEITLIVGLPELEIFFGGVKQISAKFLQRVRVYGINCPEVHTKNAAEKKAGLAAKAYAEQLVAGGPCQIKGYEGKDEKFARWLAVITLVDGSDFAARMIEAKHAKPYFGERKPVFAG